MSAAAWSSIWWTVAVAACVVVGLASRWQTAVSIGIVAVIAAARSLVWLVYSARR